MVQPLQCFQRVVEGFDMDIFFGLLNDLAEDGAASGFVVNNQYLALSPQNTQPAGVLVWFNI